MRFIFSAVVFAVVPFSPAVRAEPVALMKTMDGFRKEFPPPQTLSEQNGRSLKDVDGKEFLLSHLDGVAGRLGVKTQAECLFLLTYLKDRDPKIRFIAATAIETVVHAYPHGMSLNDILEIDSDGHREMVRRFVEKNEKLRAEGDEKKPQPANAEKAVWIGISVNQAIFLQDELEDQGALLIKFALVNDGDKAVTTDVDSWRIIVNGKEMSERDTSMMFGNGSRMEDTLPPGGHAQIAKAMGVYFKEPGTYRVSWKGKTFASPEITFRVLPSKKK